MAFYREEMACNHYLIFFFLLIGVATSAPFISYDVLDAHEHSGRALLQAKKPCNLSFENMDYSVLTSKCKGPQYPVKNCCDALKEFACPNIDVIGDRTNNCAETMFSYINLYGKYPPGLFANQCKEGREGLDCLDVQNSTSSATAHSSSLLLTFGFLCFHFNLL